MVPSPVIVTTTFATPNTPDLGCFVEHSHGFQVDGEWAIWAEFAPWNNQEGIIPHQCYFRVKCGRAAFFQRVKVWMRPQLDSLIFNGIAPDHVLGGDFRPYPSDWVKYPPQRGNQTYWFRGEHRNPAESQWRADAAAGHSYDIYDNGTISTASWDDTGGDRDFDDMILEVAIVYRRRYFDPVIALVDAVTDEVFERFAAEDFPRFRPADRPPPDEVGA
jgi:hypothetical protein